MNRSTRSETLRLVPHSGIQFLTFGFNLATTPRFTREFIGRRLMKDESVDEKIEMQLYPAWNDDDTDSAPVVQRADGDEDYTVSKDRAVATFLNEWIPVPFLAVRPGVDAGGHQILDEGPIDWVRVHLTEAEAGALSDDNNPITHHVVFAFDTEVLARVQAHYVAPSPEDVKMEHEFTLASRYEDVARFLTLGGNIPGTRKGQVRHWLQQWLLEVFAAARERQTGRPVQQAALQTVEHLAQYIAIIQFLGLAIRIPRIRFVDTYSETREEKRLVKPVHVDLVLDVGNSRTCGILIETYPNDKHVTFENTLVFGLRDLGRPHLIYRDPFESQVEFAQGRFGKEYLARFVRPSSFFWPSPVRIGPEASRLRELLESAGTTSGMSSPKRYLCDIAPVNQAWRFQSSDYGADDMPPRVALKLFPLVNSRGDVVRQISEEPKLYTSLAASIDQSRDGNPPSTLTFSRSAIFTFMLCEIIAQALSMINNPQLRKQHKDSDAPRELRKIILSFPTAMSIQEQRIMASRANAAVKLVWDLMGWTSNPPPNTRAPEVKIAWDEATCAHMVYLYSEVAKKYGGNIAGFFDLFGRPRPFVDPEQSDDDVPVDTDPNRSLRVASIDVGGGTTDLMITTYHIEGNQKLVPIQNFREGFRIAGDEVLREVIQQMLLPALGDYLLASGIRNPKAFLVDRFGANKADISEQDRQLRRQFVLRVLQPAALSVIRAAERSDFESEDRVETLTFGTLMNATSEGKHAIPAHVRGYVEREVQRLGGTSFVLEECPVPVDIGRIRSAVVSALGDVFGNIAEAVNHFDCDMVLLSGRPTRMPATIDLFVDKLAISPDRIIPLARYQVGQWYPFASHSNLRIDDPKTVTVVGSTLCVMAGEGHVTSFAVETKRFKMRSTAKYIGELDREGKLPNDRVRFRWSDDPTVVSKEHAEIPYFTQMRLGYRQLPVERWTATPLYRLKFHSQERIQLPVTVVLARKPSDGVAGYDDKRFLDQEALKEELVITDVIGRDAGLKRMFNLTLETLPSEGAYWLDTGILTVGNVGST